MANHVRRGREPRDSKAVYRHVRSDHQPVLLRLLFQLNGLPSKPQTRLSLQSLRDPDVCISDNEKLPDESGIPTDRNTEKH